MEEYISWTRKYRPTNLDDYLGAEIKESVKTRFKATPLPQVILLEGDRGCGKTSLAWLMAKEYLCLDRKEGACNECEMCKALNEHIVNSDAREEFTGISEIDVASEGNVKNIDGIIEEAMLPPMRPLRYKVIILDEFHMASKTVQNRLLKVMEQPPQHLVFILCTTNPEMILQTVLSRCMLKIRVTRADKIALFKRLKYIAENEGVNITEEALKLIIEQNDRIVRECIGKLEFLAKSTTTGQTIDTQTVLNNSTGTDIKLITSFFNASLKGLEEVIEVINQIKEKNIRPEEFLDAIINYTLASVKLKFGYNIEISEVQLMDFSKLFKEYNSNQILYLLKILEDTQYRITSLNTELALINLAQKIGRVGLYRTLENTNQKGIAETKRGENKYIESTKLHTGEVKRVDIEKKISEGVGLATIDSPIEIQKTNNVSTTLSISQIQTETEKKQEKEKLSDEEIISEFFGSL